MFRHRLQDTFSFGFILSLGVLIPLGFCGCSAASAQSPQKSAAAFVARAPWPSHEARRSIEQLVQLESRLLPPTIVDGEATHDALPDYYWSENEELLKRFAQTNARRASAPKIKTRAITFVAGAPGVGKTFLKSQIINKQADPPTCYKFDLPELYRELAANGHAEPSPDLAAEGTVINHMPRIRDRSTAWIAAHLTQNQADCYVIDSLDEVHSDDYETILQQIHDFVAASPRDYVHVAVFGRGFAFRDYWSRRNSQEAAVDVELHVLQPPKFRTTGDLLVSSCNYYTWANQLRWSSGGQASEPMPFPAFCDWSAGGFVRAGRFTDVTYSPADAVDPAAHAVLMRWARESRVVGATLYNLAGNEITRGIARQHIAWKPTAKQQGAAPQQEMQFMRSYLDAWMVRESEVDGRPSSAQPESADLYLQLLEQIAVDTLREGQIDRDGFFPLASDKVITADVAGKELTFKASQVLEHSALTWTDPRIVSEQPLYRFEPIWFHRLLVEMNGQRVSNAQERPQLSLKRRQ